MKTLFLPAVLAAFAFASCQKVMEVFDHVPIPPGVDTNKYISKDTNCTVIAQSGSFIDEEPRSHVSGFRKVINPTTNRLDSLITANGGPFEIDSFFYATEYFSDTVIHFSGVVKTYNRLNDMHLWQFETANELNFDVHLDASGHVAFTTFGPTVGIQFNYEHGRLVSVDFPHDPAPYSHVTFTYDDHGNLTKIVRGDQDNNTTYTFEYNLSHSALSQIYTPIAGYDLYEIMGWIPIAPHNLRTRATIANHITTDGTPEESVISDITYTNHVLNNFNALRQFDAHVPAIGYDVTVLNTLECEIDRSGHLPE
jgi:hypothetical protein